MFAVETGNDIFVCDVGFQFVSEDMAPGVDYVLPNTKYLEVNADRVRAVFITHGHLDHIGGLVARALAEAASAIRICARCGNIDTQNPCTVCADERRDGSIMTLWAQKLPLLDENGAADRTLTVGIDISALKAAQAQIERQQQALHQSEKLTALGSLLAGVAHELNNPLSVVVARAVLLEEQGDPAARAVAVKIRTAAERCARIVRTFLGMARQQQPEQGPVAINEVVAAALDMTAYAVRTSSIEVTQDLARDIPLIVGDADQLHQVLLNLVINAQQALQDQPAPRRIRVATHHAIDDDRVCITVTDNGPGIPAHLRARVFEPYFTTKPTGIGTGVGLAVSLGIVEAHGGTLTVDGPAAGGAVFTIALPVGDVGTIGTVTEAVTQAKAHRRTVLIVDDEAELRETLAQILMGAGHRVVAVGSGREALDRLAAQRFDVILTDMRMPDLDGRALYQEIERRWPRLAARVVFVTGDTLSSTLRDFVTESGRPVIEKPFLPSEVRRVVVESGAGLERSAR